MPPIRPLLALPLLLALAGCVSDAPTDDPIGTVTALGLAPLWTAATLIAPGADAESSVQAGPDGLVLACSHGGFWRASPVYLSRDSGQTWTELDIGPNPIVSGDCDVQFLPDGSWAVVFDTIASATVAVTQDEGASWTINYASALPIAVDRPWLAADGDALLMSYANVMAVEPAIGMVARTTDHAATWSQELYTLFEGVDRINHVHGDLLVSEDGIRIPVGRADFNGLPTAAGGTSLDFYIDGTTPWTRTHVADTQLEFVLPSMTEDGEGTMYYVVPRPSASGEGVDIHVAWSTDRGATWTESQAVATDQHLPGVVGPWIDGRPGAGATLAWRDAGDNTTFRAVTVALAPAGETGPDDATLAAGPVQDLFTSDVRPGQIYEFLMIDHSDDGTAFIVFVHDDGSGCDPDPNPLETRGAQCLWLVRSQ